MDDETADHASMDEEMNPVSYEREYQKNKVTKQLPTIFKLLNIDPIHEKSVVSSIRVRVDEVHRKLRQLCDLLDEEPLVSYDPKPHDLRISE
ncbi:unnamed protein product [Rotaria socialis]|uniref:Uncharacterized protein n=1 Tax=Rotaria socialis TaxID=392032 RepID=A0A820SL71_9BILA|nr:unnamed protein product [Rotaria socialis]